MYDSIRDVAQQEIFNSYRGILRISPYFVEEAERDDTSDLYNKNHPFYNSEEKTISPDESQPKINLSDSEGNLFNIYFYPETFNCSVVGKMTTKVDLVNIVHYYNVLRVNKNINVKSTLSCDTLEVKFNNNILKYPIDCPYNSKYCNANDGLGIGDDLSADNIENKFSDPDIVSKISDYEQVKVDDQVVWRRSTDGTKIPEVYRHDYILGHAAGGTYKNTNTNLNETQLSFISLDKLIWEKLTAALRGVSINRSYEGRYTGLGVNETEDVKFIFGNDWSEQNIKAAAPIVGIPVQSGLIMYSAMPLQRYCSHLNDIDLKNDPSDNYVYNLISEYALCDGKVLKYSTGNKKTDYSNIEQNSKNWSNFTFDSTKNTLYNKMHHSMMDNNNDNHLHTPALFETDQISPRYIRGLNWKPKTYDENTVAIAKSPSGEIDINELGNNIKNLTEVGPYLGNHDYKVRKTADHKHLCLSNQNAVPSPSADTLYKNSNWLSGRAVNRESIIPLTNTSETGYKDSANAPTKYHGTNILQTRAGKINREWQDIPIAVGGGTRSFTCSVGYQWKDNQLVFGAFGKKWCKHDGDPDNNGRYAPGYFYFRSINTNNDSQWRTISSSNKHFIVYGIAENDNTPTVATKYSLVNNSTKVDDTLSFPATFNFLPLIKI